jgi:hypothetical protein
VVQFLLILSSTSEVGAEANLDDDYPAVFGFVLSEVRLWIVI